MDSYFKIDNYFKIDSVILRQINNTKKSNNQVLWYDR